jgi:hypothetical protein
LRGKIRKEEEREGTKKEERREDVRGWNKDKGMKK